MTPAVTVPAASVIATETKMRRLAPASRRFLMSFIVSSFDGSALQMRRCCVTLLLVRRKRPAKADIRRCRLVHEGALPAATIGHAFSMVDAVLARAPGGHRPVDPAAAAADRCERRAQRPRPARRDRAQRPGHAAGARRDAR